MELGQVSARIELAPGALERHVEDSEVREQQNDGESAVVAVERLGHDDERDEVREENLVLCRRGDGVVGRVQVWLVRARYFHEDVGQ